MQIIFDDNGLHQKLAPFSLTRPVAEIRFGILTLRESWIRFLSEFTNETIEVRYGTQSYLEGKFKPTAEFQSALRIMSNIKPTRSIAEIVAHLKRGEALYAGSTKIAVFGTTENVRVEIDAPDLLQIQHPWHIFQHNHAAINIDFELLTKNRQSVPIDPDRVRVSAIGGHQIFLEEGAKLEHVILNADNGPIYIGKNATIMEGSIIRGPFAMLEGSVIKMGAKIYDGTTIGPECKVGGEVSNSVFQAYSNKGHDGFLGNSVIGEWCNLGADTNSSNLKNNYSNVRVYSYETENFEDTGVLFCGVLMGDHSKTGINTMLNTATVVGVSANIFGGGFPAKYLPSFTWGGVEKTDRFKLDKAFEVAQNMMKRRKQELTVADKQILTHIFENLA